MNRVRNTGVQGWGIALALYAAFLTWAALAPPARRSAPRPQPTRVTLVESRPAPEPVAPPAPEPPAPAPKEVAKRKPPRTPPAPAPLLPAQPTASPSPTPPAPRRFAVSLEATVPGGSGVAVPTAAPGTAPALRATPGGTSDRPDAPAYVVEPDAPATILAALDAAEVRKFYPEAARRASLEGDVRLELDVSATGEVTGSRVVRGAGNGFDEVAQRLVKRLRFRPAIRGGKPAPSTVPWTFKFRLEG